MTLLARHIGRTVFGHSLVAVSVLLVLFMVVEFIDLVEADRFGTTQILGLLLLSAPQMIYELFPMAVLLGTMGGLALLANDSELVVMRASGFSRRQITLAVLRVGLLFFLVTIALGEFVAPFTERQAQLFRASAQQENILHRQGRGLWVRDGDHFVHIAEVLPDESLRGVRIYTLEHPLHLESLLHAQASTFGGDHWVLQDVKQTRILPEGMAEATTLKRMFWETAVTPEMLSVFLVKPEQLAIWQLRPYIAHLAANQQHTKSFELAFWSRLVLPVSAAVMVVLAVPFAFSSARSQQVGRSLFTGILLGLAFYALNRALGYVVLANGMGPFLGAVLPTAGFLLFALEMMRRKVF